ncbi:glutamate carboxypeptidase [Variovorax boronicumulans]|uniref:Glutamate carboxypeptidase n=1 Tax=Variovorax boronicumulans TaxID=436515 RepID=A0AAW8E1D5_9BURK|nr:glutamate carboxypeptidase [Variovorax boronicumulans]MDP9880356.1 glutamate carboxypeptidase [Variovorax boronicumulans]MDP9925642.1 glutamate carboxypeptidase [Variovorax boronicumulans]
MHLRSTPRSWTRAACQGAVLASALLAASAMAQKPHQGVLDAATQQKDETLQLLERMVNIDSGSTNTEGLAKVREMVADELRKLDARIESFPAEPHPGTSLVATLTGQGKKKILILAHIDTVFKDGTAAAKPFYIKDGRAYGPGVMDNKGGVVAGLQALKILQKIGFKDYGQITFLIDTNEETGSVGTSALIERVAKQHDVALNLEPGRPADGLVVERKGSATALIEVKGLASHAGVAPEAGRNAAMEVAHQVLQLSKVADAVKKTTVNFTVLTANGPTNVIPASASAKGDVRAATPEELDRVEKDLTRIAQNKLIPETEVRVRLVRGLPPMPRSPASDKLVRMAEGIYGEIGKKLTIESSGGAADASLVAGVGVPVLDGFGIVGGGIHTPEEYAEVESVVPRLYLLSRMLMDLSAN